MVLERPAHWCLGQTRIVVQQQQQSLSISQCSVSHRPTWANTMADTKTANISRLVIKQAGRAKEKVINIMIHTHVSLQLVSQ